MTGRKDSLHSADHNRRMFAQVVQRYDLLNRILSLGLDNGWRQRAVNRLAPQAGGCYLDIGCGTGDMALAVLRREPAATVAGIDPVAGMLVLAAAKARRAGAGQRLWVQVADAARLPFGDGSMHGITCAFCIRNVESRAAVLAEMFRVLGPAAVATIIELTEPRQLLMGLLHRCYCSVWVPLVGALLSRGDAYRYLTSSIRHFPRPQTVVAELQAAGFHEATAEPLSGGIVTLFSAVTGGVAENRV